MKHLDSRALHRILIISILIIVLLNTSPNRTSLVPASIISALSQGAADPLGTIQGTAAPAGISWTGDGQRILNPSFETGSLTPWLQAQNNTASGSGASIRTQGYTDTYSAGLTALSGTTIFSGNTTTNSYVTLFQDLSQQHVGFSSSVRLRAAVQLQQLTGTSSFDRAEISLAITSSTGGVRTIHYVLAHGSPLPSNSTTDAYFSTGATPTGQWVTIDRDVAADAAATFPSVYSTLDSVTLVSLTVYSQTRPGPENIEPRIRFWNSTGAASYAPGELVVYDADNNGAYDPSAGDTVIGGCSNPLNTGYLYNLTSCASVPNGQKLASDPYNRIKFADMNGNGVYDIGEPVIYDCTSIPGDCNTNTYGIYAPVIAGPAPPLGTPLAQIIHEQTGGLFDAIELYSADGGAQWIRNGGFESGLNNWAANSSFTTSTSTVHSGTYSAQAAVTSSSAEMAQTIDAKPIIDTSTRFAGYVNTASATGTSTSDMVDIWLGLVDSQYNPVSLYYVFKTGDGSMPTNRTDSVYLKAPGFGNLNQWLTVNDSLSQDTSFLNTLGYSPPYSVEIIVLEVDSPGGSSTTTAYFDDISIHSAYHTGTAPSAYYGLDGLNTTYVYTAASIPQGSLHIEIPRGESVLNITSPEGTALQRNEYATGLATACTVSPCIPNPRTVDIPDSTFFKHAPVGTWKFYATSTNMVANIYAEDPSTHNPDPNPNVGSAVNLVSQIKDPLSNPLQGVADNLTLWNTATGAEVGSWVGSTNSFGWWNVSSVTLPPSGNPAGIYRLQATVVSTYVGIRSYQISVRYLVALSLSLSSAQISQGDTITISGSVTQTINSNPAQGVNVTIEYRLAGNSQWTVLGNATTDSSGHYSFTWSPQQGDYQVKAATGDVSTSPAESTPLQVSVGPPGFLQQYWPILVAVGAAAAVAVGVIFIRRRKEKAQTKTPA